MDRSHLLLTTRQGISSQRGERPFSIRLLVAVVALLLLGATAEAQPLPDDTRGYVSRACGFDMNDNGIVGEPGDDGCTAASVRAGTCDPGDCNVCDGVTTDVDGDGDDEDLIYVDCNSGNDTSGNGSPGNPYRTIAKAFSVADGPGDGREDIICARATCSPANGSRLSEQNIPVSGVANKGPSGNWFYLRPRKGPEERDFQYPSDPVMVVGWDTDNDGEYPPYDTNQPEPLVFDACSVSDCSSGTTTATGFKFSSDRDFIELAHFTMRNYGRAVTGSGASIDLVGSGIKTGVYMHDLSIENTNYRRAGENSRAVVWAMLGGSRGFTWFAFENVRITDYGSWSFRGNINAQYLRFRNLDLVGVEPENGGNSPGWKLWGQKDAEYLNLRFDTDVENMDASNVSGVNAVWIDHSSENVVLRNNSYRNCSRCVILEYRVCNSGDQSFCSDAGNQVTTRNITFDRQLFVRDSTRIPSYGAAFIQARAMAADGKDRGGAERTSDPNCTDPVGLENLKITNSVFLQTVGTATALNFKIGSNCAGAPLGPVTIENNTFVVNPSGGPHDPVIEIGTTTNYNYDYRYYAQSYRVRNNVFSGIDGDAAIFLQHRGSHGYYGDTKFPSDFLASSNSYGRNAEFVRDTTNYSSLSSWQGATGYENGSADCDTSFTSDRYRLTSADTCAKDKGNNAWCPTTDIDGRGRARSAGDPCDRGADEEGNGGAPVPDPDPDPDPVLSAPVLREAVPVPAR